MGLGAIGLAGLGQAVRRAGVALRKMEEAHVVDAHAVPNLTERACTIRWMVTFVGCGHRATFQVLL